MSFTPFHDIADQLEAIAGELRTQGDAVHLGTFTVPATPQEPDPEGPDVEPPDPTDPTDPDEGNGDGSPGDGDNENGGDEQVTPSSTYAPPPKR